jgi:hypothetical protein
MERRTSTSLKIDANLPGLDCVAILPSTKPGPRAYDSARLGLFDGMTRVDAAGSRRIGASEAVDAPYVRGHE